MQLALARNRKAPMLQPIGLKQHHPVAMLWRRLGSIQVAAVRLPGQAGLQSLHPLPHAVQGAALTCPDADCGAHPCRQAERWLLLMWQMNAVFLPSASWHWAHSQLLCWRSRQVRTSSLLLNS